MDPAEFRRRNFIKKFPHQTPVIMTYDAGDYEASLNKALELADYKGFGRRKRESARNGKLRGIGFSSYIEACGIAPSAGGRLARRRRRPVGIGRGAGQPDRHGRGADRLAQPRPGPRDHLRAARLRPPRHPDRHSVAIVHGDTDKVQFGMGTYGSRSGAVGMSAIAKALDKVDRQGQEGRRPRAWRRPRATSSSRTASSRSPAPTSRLAFGEVALQAYIAHKFSGQELEPGLKEGAFYDPTNFTFPAGVPHLRGRDRSRDRRRRRSTRWTAVDDFGIVINPMIVEGQVHGGIAQGVGQALLEGAIYDESPASS